MEKKRAHFDTLVTRYYPAVYTFASRLTDDPKEAVLLTHEAFNTTRKQLWNRRDEVEIVTTLLDAVIRAGFVAAGFKSHEICDTPRGASLARHDSNGWSPGWATWEGRSAATGGE
jgi:hypothetical protein